VAATTGFFRRLTVFISHKLIINPDARFIAKAIFKLRAFLFKLLFRFMYEYFLIKIWYVPAFSKLSEKVHIHATKINKN
jgi:hypothetical protein